MIRTRNLACAALLTGFLAATGSAQQALTTTRVASGLWRPVTATAPPGEYERVYIVEQNAARILVLRNGVVQPTPFLTVSGVQTSGNEQGLLGLAFHPDYQNNGKFYVNYTGTAGSGDTFVVEYTAASPDVANPTPGPTIISFNQPQSNHNGGHVAFGADGKLYIGTGDGGSANDSGSGHVAGGNAQSGANLLGKMLRLDVDIAAPYIPGDNPFVLNGSIRDEIWALGLRNPFRYSFDRETGDLYIGDVGQNAREEVNVETPGNGGLNYGWRCMEGFNCTGLSGCTCGVGLTDPIIDYTHAQGCSIAGGYVYRGCAIPTLQGTYFYGDFCSGTIWSLQYDTGTQTISNFTVRTAELAPGGGQSIDTISSFGEDGHGEIYICDFGPSFGSPGQGEVYKIVPGDGQDSGDFYCVGKTTSQGCIPFLTSIGSPSVTATSPFRVTGNDLVPNEAGFYIYGVNGRLNLNFHGGKLCVKSPVQRLLPPKVATDLMNPPCDGQILTNFNNRIQNGSDPVLTAGQRVYMQLRQRDPLDPTGFGDNLTDAVDFIICN